MPFNAPRPKGIIHRVYKITRLLHKVTGMKHILETYKDKELTEQVKEKLEKAETFQNLLHLHSQLKKINKDWEIGIEIKKQ